MVEYHNNTSMSNSKLNWLNKSPLHYKYFSENTPQTTKAQELGRLIHLALLRPIEFSHQYFALPSLDKRTILGKAISNIKITENEGKTGLETSIYDHISAIQRAVFKHKQAEKLLQGVFEKPYYWIDEDTLVSCKTKPDIVNRGLWIADIITTACADPSTFEREIMCYGYHRKAAFQLDGAGEEVPYYLILVEKQAPYAVSVLKLNDELIEKGRAEYKALLKQYLFCKLYDCWPGYEIKQQPALLPAMPALRIA